jgi:hypothetical protein
MTALIQPRLRVQLEQPNSDELIEIDVQTDNRDMTSWDFQRSRRNYPDPRTAPSIWMTFLAWNAIRRGPDRALVPDTFDAFNEICVQVTPLTADGDEVTGDEVTDDVMNIGGFPTNPAPGIAYASS